ncbi:hypothetical protein SS50377_28210 [Spironucleus salmonicida]|uniref:Uncharacterized protein n=1 Tax=Spironucleus salmonicida TaxID=348837 RepID=A0A9P8LL67_9EUKA|nr:hypothetical protein SS50377_28197 [Spironucleus salmonicida]KAH0570235.1 hypothetical protein SS50377_28210 [Spironucleus salmonicida]
MLFTRENPRPVRAQAFFSDDFEAVVVPLLAPRAPCPAERPPDVPEGGTTPQPPRMFRFDVSRARLEFQARAVFCEVSTMHPRSRIGPPRATPRPASSAATPTNWVALAPNESAIRLQRMVGSGK